MKSTARDKPAPGWRPDQLRAGPSRSSRTGRGRGRARRRCFPAPPVRCGAPTPSGTRARRPPAPPSLPSSSSCAAGSRGHDVARPFRFRTGTWTGECASCPGAVNPCTPRAPLVSLPPSLPAGRSAKRGGGPPPSPGHYWVEESVQTPRRAVRVALRALSPEEKPAKLGMDQVPALARRPHDAAGLFRLDGHLGSG